MVEMISKRRYGRLAGSFAIMKYHKLPTVIRIESIVRRMSGRSQAHLIKGHDGRLYVTKFQDNPQGNRTLVNEWIGHFILERLLIPTPGMRILQLTQDCSPWPAFIFADGRRRTVSPGRHLGFEVPVNLDKVALFDFLPLKMLSKVSNLEDFGAIYVADRWLSHQDSRQALFYANPGGSSRRLRAVFIDNGYLLGGPQWTFSDSHLHGIYGAREVYSFLNMPDACERTIHAIQEIDLDELRTFCHDLPNEWLTPADKPALEAVFATLARRQTRLRKLVEEHSALLRQEFLGSVVLPAG